MTVTRGQDIELAARHLQAGRLVAFPTETVYGLGADAQNQTAIAAVFTAKGRPSNHPVIVHVADAQAVSAWADTISPQAKQDRKSTRLNSSHVAISYAVFCLKK